MTKRLLVALALVATLGGCGIFKGKGGPKTAVLGERIPVLGGENDATVEPTLAAATVVLPAAVANDAWAQPGGNASKSIGHVALATSPTRAWSASIPKSSGAERFAATPVVADGRLYVIDTEAVVRAFSTSNGSRLWQSAIDTKSGSRKDRKVLFGGGVSFEGGKLYATDGRGDVTALDAATGKQLWTVRLSTPLRGAPSIGGGNLYVVSQDNQLFALRPDTGETIWTDSATLETAGVFGVAAPAIAQGTVVAGFSSGELSALRYENGRVVWQDQLSRTSISTSVSSISDIDASPVIDQGKVYAIGQGGRTVAMDLVTGQRLWELNVGGIATPAIAGDWLFVVTDDAKLLCISRISGKIRWITQLERYRDPKTRNKAINWYGPVLAGGKLWLVSTRGTLLGVSATDGTRDAPIKAGDDFALAPIVAGNTLYLLDNKGRITAWR